MSQHSLNVSATAYMSCLSELKLVAALTKLLSYSIHVLPECCCVARTYVSISQHTSAYVSIRQHTSAYVPE